MSKSIEFYTNILDFSLVGTWPQTASPTYSILVRDGAELHLSEFPGDSIVGAVAMIIVPNVHALFKHYRSRGLNSNSKKDSPVHLGPVKQTWGTTEFYVQDPSGNTLRFVERPIN